MTGMHSTRQSLAEDAIGVLHSNQINRTPSVPLGFRRDGRPIFPIAGGSEESEGSGGSEGGGGDTKDQSGSGEESEDDEDEEGSGSSSESESEEKEKPKEGSLEARVAALEDEKQRQYKRRKEAETERDQAKQKLKELEDKDKDDNTKNAERLQELESDNQELGETLRESRLEIAFLKDNTYSWHNPGRALELADLSEVEIDKDGKVHGLKEALDKLAETDPYLIKKEEKSEEKNDEEQSNRKKTGEQKNKRKDKESDRSKRRKELVDKYPGLRR